MQRLEFDFLVLFPLLREMLLSIHKSNDGTERMGEGKRVNGVEKGRFLGISTLLRIDAIQEKRYFKLDKSLSQALDVMQSNNVN